MFTSTCLRFGSFFCRSIFLSVTGLVAAFAFACGTGSIRAKLHYSRVRFAANHFRTVRTQNQAMNGSSGTSFTLMYRPTPEPPLSPPFWGAVCSVFRTSAWRIAVETLASGSMRRRGIAGACQRSLICEQHSGPPIARRNTTDSATSN